MPEPPEIPGARAPILWACRAEGCGVVDMECAALSAVAEFRNVQFGQFLYVADTLADADAYDARNWGEDSLAPAMALCIEIAGRD